jgi:hypothetical protein
MIREGKIPNAGRRGAPRIARQNLPGQKVANESTSRDVANAQIVQSIIKEGVG